MNYKNPIYIILAILLAAFFFWPTIFRYEILRNGESDSLLRINRVTGFTESFNGRSWAPEKWLPANPYAERIPGSVAEEITAEILFSSSMGSLSGSVYNTSEWVITGIEVFGTVFDTGGDPRWSGPIREAVLIQPYSMSHVTIPIAGLAHHRANWKISAFFGAKR